MTLAIQGTNDAPVLSSSSYSLSSVIEKIDSLSNNGNTIGEVVSNGISDIDSDPNNLSVAITSLDESNGPWQYRLVAAESWIDTVQASVSESNALLLHASNHIRFSPNEGFHGEALANLTVAWDQTTGTVGESGDASTNGDNTAFSTNQGTASITIISSNVAPTLEGVRTEATMHSGIAQVRTGQITFEDSDTEDSPVASTSTVTLQAYNSSGNIMSLTSAQQESIKQTFILSQENNTNEGSIDWSYEASSSQFNFLSSG